MSHGEELRALREAAGLAQGVVAWKLAWPQSKLCRAERGTQPLSEPDFLRAKAAILELKAEAEKAWVRARRAEVGPDG